MDPRSSTLLAFSASGLTAGKNPVKIRPFGARPRAWKAYPRKVKEVCACAPPGADRPRQHLPGQKSRREKGPFRGPCCARFPARRSTPPSSRLELPPSGGGRLLLAAAAALEPLDHGGPWAALLGSLLQEATGDRVAYPAAFARASLLSHALNLLQPTCSFNILRGRRVNALVALLVDRVERIDLGGFGAAQHVPVQVERRGDAGVPEPLLYALRVRPAAISSVARACRRSWGRLIVLACHSWAGRPRARTCPPWRGRHHGWPRPA
jgi:hypothetical protein